MVINLNKNSRGFSAEYKNSMLGNSQRGYPMTSSIGFKGKVGEGVGHSTTCLH